MSYTKKNFLYIYISVTTDLRSQKVIPILPLTIPTHLEYI